MVVVLTHQIVAAILFHRNPSRFLTCNNLQSFQTELKELLKKLEDTADVNKWFPLIEDAIKVQTTKPVCSVVYAADINTGNLQDVWTNPLPEKGVCWQAYKTKEAKSTRLLEKDDPLVSIAKQKCTFGPKYVFCQPVKDGNQVISIIAVLTVSNQDFNPESLKSISEKIVGCYRQLCKCHTQSLEQNSTSGPPVQNQTGSLKEAIIQLCGDLYDQEAEDLQIKVLKFLEDHTNAEVAFLLLVVPETHELFCQVIRGKILEEEVRFPGHASSFALALERKLPITLDDIPMDKRPGIEQFIGCKLKSMLCVPVSSRANDKLIAIACVVNKVDRDNFTNDDIQVIKQCFQYTSTVLTSTLAFQNERKLKIQTQAMLQVARNLFTHLGEFTKVYGKGMDDFPYIKSGLFEVNILGLPFNPVYFKSHSRFYSPMRIGNQINNSAVLEMNRKVDEEIEKQGRVADRLFGFEHRKSSPEKALKHGFEQKKSSPEKASKLQPKLKSPNKRERHSPEKHYGRPYEILWKPLDVEDMEETPILESTRCNKPDIVLGTEKAVENITIPGDGLSVMAKEDGISNAQKKVDFDDMKLSFGQSASADKLSEYEDADLPPFTPTYERTVRHYFTPPKVEVSQDTDSSGEEKESDNENYDDEGDDDVFENASSTEEKRKRDNNDDEDVYEFPSYSTDDGRKSNDNVEDDMFDKASYITARSPPLSVMYSAEDEMEDSKDADFDSERESSFYDPWREIGLKAQVSRSETTLHDSNASDEMARHLHISDNDFEQPDARISTSEPSFSKTELIEESPASALDVTDSKPEFNEAFIKGGSESTIGKTNSTASQTISNHSDFQIHGQTDSIIIEDVDSLQKVTLNLKVSDSDSGFEAELEKHQEKESNVQHVQIVFDTKFDYANEVLRKNDVIRTESVPLGTNDLTKLLREIMQEARNLTQAERCSVFLIDQETDELVAKVFDGVLANDNEVQSEIRMPITQGIAGHVATTGNLLNIKDAYAHPMFYRGIDDSTGFRTRNILCFPIKNETDNVLGVAQLCNKMNGPYFTTFDEDVASAFAVYCCISISHVSNAGTPLVRIAETCRNLVHKTSWDAKGQSLMYQKLQRSQYRNKLANELMIYHMQVATEEVHSLAQSEIKPVTYWHQNFSKFLYPPREVPEDDTPMCCLSMFEDLGFITRWRIKRDTLARFILMVKKGYRNPPYHNWMHAFAVAHFCYLCIKNLKLQDYLEDIEMFALFVSCLCHDIDHRGTNNSYQVASKSVLAALYSSEGAVLERHHFAQTMCIVNTEGCNIYENLISKDYQQVLDLMRDIILATDLAHHLKILKNIEAMAKEKYNKSSLKHRKMLLCLLMTASDLSDQTKPWDSTKHIAALIYNEFFSQGDLEKSLGRTPTEMMDREKARIPDLQIGFLDHIALPVYRVLEEIFIDAKSVHTSVKDNRKHWERICALIKIRRGGSCEQMSYDQILALEEEANTLPEEEIQNVQQNGH